ncbi:MAG: hypothetical protein DMF80_16230 [Acidobacteria bacterium]|nr:MAG: hypothetical protein DMF80_16230 [Acidobacteriota bacterium]
MRVHDPEAHALRRGLGVLDLACAALLVVMVLWYSFRFVSFSHYPEEDAAMLLRYSEHVAQGQGVVWNVGEKPVDGATDFLFMIVVGCLIRAGFSVTHAAQETALVCHTLTVLGIFLGTRALSGGRRAAAAVSAAYLAVGPGLRYAAASYGTPLTALLALATWLVAMRVEVSPPQGAQDWARLLGACTALLGMARPEGALLGLFCFATVVLLRDRGERNDVLKAFCSTFVPLGLVCFTWHWSCFGDPLPNPFYRKAGGAPHWYALARAFLNIASLGGVFLAVLAAGPLFRRTRRASLVALVPVAAFGAIWVLVSDETNYFMRFRYPVLPLILVSAVPVGENLAEGVLRRLRGRGRVLRATLAAAVVSVALGVVAVQERHSARIEPRRIGLYDVALRLRPLSSRSYALATTEAGLLPLYSRWRAIDAWGLNDSWIAHHGGITEQYLDRYRPEVIMFHAYFTADGVEESSDTRERGLGPSWSAMVETLKRYAEQRGYVQAAVFARSTDAHYYYVRPDFPESEKVIGAIRATRYRWDGELLRPGPTPPGRGPG